MGKPFWSPCPEPATWCQMKDEEPVLCCLRDARLPASSKSIVLYLCHFLKWWVFSAKKRPCDRRSSLAQTFASISGQDGGSRGFQTQVLLEVFPRFCRKAAGPVGLRGAYRGGHTAVFLGPRRRETGGGRKCKSVLKRSLFNKPHLWSVREVRIRCGSPSSGLPSPLPASFHARPYAHALLLSAPHPPPRSFSLLLPYLSQEAGVLPATDQAPVPLAFVPRPGCRRHVSVRTSVSVPVVGLVFLSNMCP